MPHFVSVTYGAGGSTRDLTHDLVERIKTTTKLTPIPHLDLRLPQRRTDPIDSASIR
jgi:5,10-methylenetetrahydrofolate reductase